MKILISLGAIPSVAYKRRLLARLVRPILEAAVQANQNLLRNLKVPPLYQCGVRYQNEPEGTNEEFALIPVVLARKWGDCDDLAPWRCAELREQGENAKIRVSWKVYKPSGFALYHVTVRRADGTIEDPSKILGMGKPVVAKQMHLDMMAGEPCSV